MRNDATGAPSGTAAAVLAAEIALRYRTGRTFSETVFDPSVARLAVEDLIQSGKIDIARDFIARHLPQLDHEVFGALLRVMSALPAGYDGGDFIAATEPDAEFSLVAGAEDATVLFVVFTGQHLRFNFPLPIVHGFLHSTRCPVLYLRDNSRTLFSGGIGIAPSKAALIQRIEEARTRLGCRRTAVLGSSSGSFAALQYAPDIAASHAICLAGPTRFDPEDQRPQIRRIRDAFDQQNVPQDAVTDRLSALNGRIRYYYGEGNVADSKNGRHLAQAGHAEVIGLRNHWNHVVLDALCAIGSFQADLRSIVENADFPDPTSYPAFLAPLGPRP